MLKRWKQAIDKGEYISVMYMDLSKAFDTVNHDILLGKLKAYGFSTSALNSPANISTSDQSYGSTLK